MNYTDQKTDKQPPTAWFWQQVSRDALCVGTVTWLVLLLLETIKPGIASNYLSLTRLATGLVLLVFIHLFLRGSPSLNTPPTAFTHRDLGVLVVASLFAVWLLVSFMPRFDLLTLLVISVTVLAIWIGSFLYAET